MSDTSDSDFADESDPVPSSAWQRGGSSRVNPFDARRGAGTAAQRTKAADKRGSRLTLDGNFKQVPAKTRAGEQGRYAGPADEMSGEEDSSGVSRAQPKKRSPVGGRAQGAERTASRTRGFGSERVYEVREGDTLFDIAREELGAAERWSDIYDLNTRELGNDFTYLEPGTQLVLPDIETAADATTQRRRRTFER
jgi:nucleoid-associated protein YgaU